MCMFYYLKKEYWPNSGVSQTNDTHTLISVLYLIWFDFELD